MRPHKNNERGYLILELYKNGKAKIHKVHRLVAKAFVPNPENNPQVNHKDTNKLNNNDWNLEWVTDLENLIHAYRNHLKIAAQGGEKLQCEIYREDG